MSDGLLNISERVNIAFHALCCIAAFDDDFAPVNWLAKALPVSPTYLAKVMQPLVKAGYVSSKRGPTGGFALIKKPKDITLYDLVLFYDGALPPKDGCIFSHRYCTGGACIVQKLNAKIYAEMERELRKITVKRIKKDILCRADRSI